MALRLTGRFRIAAVMAAFARATWARRRPLRPILLPDQPLPGPVRASADFLG